MIGKRPIADFLDLFGQAAQIGQTVLRGAKQKLSFVLGIQNSAVRCKERIFRAHLHRLQILQRRKRGRRKRFEPFPDDNCGQRRTAVKRVVPYFSHAVGNFHPLQRLIHERGGSDYFDAVPYHRFVLDPHAHYERASRIHQIAVRVINGVILRNGELLHVRAQKDTRADMRHRGRQPNGTDMKGKIFIHARSAFVGNDHAGGGVKRRFPDIFQPLVQRDGFKRLLKVHGVRNHDPHACGQNEIGFVISGRHGVQHAVFAEVDPVRISAVQHAVDRGKIRILTVYGNFR